MRLDPYNLRLQLSRMFDQGQSFFCTFKVQDWLRERQHNPEEYEIIFHQKPSPPETGLKMIVEIELRRRDGQAVDPELIAEINQFV
ncbi:MAG: hypothetical protein ACRC6M_01075 [Microcystaceae cyanobacterium]